MLREKWGDTVQPTAMSRMIPSTSRSISAVQLFIVSGTISASRSSMLYLIREPNRYRGIPLRRAAWCTALQLGRLR